MSGSHDTKQLLYSGTLTITKEFKAHLFLLKNDQRCFRTLLVADSVVVGDQKTISKEDQFKLRQLADFMNMVYTSSGLTAAQSSVIPSPYPRETAVWVWGLGEVGQKYTTFGDVPFVGFTTKDRKYRFSDTPISWSSGSTLEAASIALSQAISKQSLGTDITYFFEYYAPAIADSVF